MKKIARAGALSFLLVCASLTASAATVNWTGPSDFDDGTGIAFPGFVANQLASINQDTAYMHNHGDTSVVFGLEIELDGNWVTIATFQPPDGFDYGIGAFGTATFATGTVTGLRFTESSLVANGFHGFDSDASFTFDASAVPEPGSFALLGLGGTALAVIRRRKKS